STTIRRIRKLPNWLGCSTRPNFGRFFTYALPSRFGFLVFTQTSASGHLRFRRPRQGCARITAKRPWEGDAVVSSVCPSHPPHVGGRATGCCPGGAVGASTRPAQ